MNHFVVNYIENEQNYETAKSLHSVLSGEQAGVLNTSLVFIDDRKSFITEDLDVV